MELSGGMRGMDTVVVLYVFLVEAGILSSVLTKVGKAVRRVLGSNELRHVYNSLTFTKRRNNGTSGTQHLTKLLQPPSP